MSRILVVEDNRDALELLMDLLREWGYVVDGAGTAQSALAKVAEQCPDAIISDLMMPGMSGMDLLREIRSRNATCKSIFVLLTGHASVAAAVTAIEQGADEFLTKPVDVDRLRVTLESHGLYGAPSC